MIVVIICKNRFWPIPIYIYVYIYMYIYIYVNIYICSYWCGCHQAEWIVERQTGKSWLIKVKVSPVNMNEYCPTPKNQGVSWNKGMGCFSIRRRKNIHTNWQNRPAIMTWIYRFPEIGLPPVLIHLWMGFSMEINHPFLGIPMAMENPICIFLARGIIMIVG